jgi:uncharacterized protein YjiS (DUF1127 family)
LHVGRILSGRARLALSPGSSNHRMEGGCAMDRKRTFDNLETDTVPAFPSHTEINRHIARAQQLRAEATTQMLIEAGRGMASILRPVLAGLVRWQERRRTYDALMRCSDRVLADIGIEREHISLIARGIDPRGHESRVDALQRWWVSARARLSAAREARQERLRVYRELMSYRDHELDDLGVRRSDIGGIARGGPALRGAQ